MNADFPTDATVTVRWNALEKTILSHLNGGNGCGQATEQELTHDEAMQLAGKLGKAMDPDNGLWTVPDRFHKEDHTGKVPLTDLYHKVEVLAANIERYDRMTEGFRYDETMEY